MSIRLSHARLRALAAGSVATAALAVGVGVATSATAATPAAAAGCTGISFSVLHNDQSGGVTLPAGKYTVSSPNLSCQIASSNFTTFLNKYNGAIPGWTGKAIAKGWGTYTKNGTNTQFTVKWSKATGGTVKSCLTRNLKVSLGPANGTAGTTFYPLQFLNAGTTSCTLKGYPGVSAVTSSGQQIGNPASRNSAKFQTVTLAPGKQRSASVGIVDTGNFSPTTCAPVTAAGMKIFPPNQSKPVTLKKKFSTCSSTTTTSLQVGPVK
jgi:Protein of unknown function (DUF4232)